MNKQAQPPFRRGHRALRNKGSALLVTVVFAAVIAVGISGLLSMLFSDWKMTARTSAQEAAFTLAESGIEEGFWAVTEYASDAEWTDAGWKQTDDFWYREWDLADLSSEIGEDFTLDQGREGKYRVIVEKTNGSTMNVVSQGIVRGGKNVPDDFVISRHIEARVNRPNPFQGLIAGGNINFNGQPFFDSFDSRILVTYDSAINAGYEAIVGSIQTALSALGLGNATVRGNLVTGASEADASSDPSASSKISGETIWEFEITFPDVIIPDTTGWNTTL